MLHHIIIYFLVIQLVRASPFASPEEIAEELLFIRGSVVLDHESQASSLVLVLWQTKLREVSLVIGVVGVNPLLHLAQSADHHLATEHLLHRVLVKSRLGDGLRDGVAVLVASDKSLPPLGVLGKGGRSPGQIPRSQWHLWYTPQC